MSKWAIPTTAVGRQGRRPRRPRLNASASVVSSSVPVVTPASPVVNKVNLAGGLSFSMSDKMEFLTTCLTWALLRKNNGKCRCYEDEATRWSRIQKLIPKVGALFAAKVALVIRIADGGRTISHALAGMIAPYASGEPWAEDFYYQIAVRADDLCEIAAATWKFNGKPRKNQRVAGKNDKPGMMRMKLPRAMVRAFARVFNRLDGYKLAKYQAKSKNPSLKQLMQMVHPKPKDGVQAALFHEFLGGRLTNTQTWESQLSAVGQTGGSKGETWARLIAGRKLGPLALLKNLRNIGEHCPAEVVDMACAQLRDAQVVKNCGILPAQYLTAYEQLSGAVPHLLKLKAAIDDSVEIAAGNVPSIGDQVLLAIDESGSMNTDGGATIDATAIFAATLLKANPKAEVMFFANNARYVTFNRKLPIMKLIAAVKAEFRSGGTNFNVVFEHANKAYDTIAILSDQEGWIGKGLYASAGAPILSRQAYVNKHNINPLIYSFDMGGDGSLMFREDSVITVAGSSFLIFKLLNYLKTDRKKLIDVFDRVEIGKKLIFDEEFDED